jgi:hypothetical protein
MAFVEALEKPGPAAAATPQAEQSPGLSPNVKETERRSSSHAPDRRSHSQASTRQVPGQAEDPRPAQLSDSPGEFNADEDATGQPADESGLTVQMITERWRQVLSLVRQRNPTTQGLLNSGKLMGVKDGVLYLGYSEVLKHKMEKSENIEIVQQVMNQVFGREIPVR